LTCFLIPVPRGIVYTVKPRFQLRYKVKNIDKFQVTYYLITTVVIILLSIVKIIKPYWITLYFYFLLFRTIVFCYIKISDGGSRKKVEMENQANYSFKNEVNRGGREDIF
jgi:hypothetical protein